MGGWMKGVGGRRAWCTDPPSPPTHTRALTQRTHPPTHPRTPHLRLVGDGEEAQLVQRVGGVGDELAQEDVLVGVEGVDDDVHQARHLGLQGIEGQVQGGWQGVRGWAQRVLEAGGAAFGPPRPVLHASEARACKPSDACAHAPGTRASRRPREAPCWQRRWRWRRRRHRRACAQRRIGSVAGVSLRAAWARGGAAGTRPRPANMRAVATEAHLSALPATSACAAPAGEEGGGDGVCCSA